MLLDKHRLMLLKCSKCGENEFSYSWSSLERASINDEGVLEVYKNITVEVDDIHCKGCMKSYSPDDFQGLI